MNIKRCWNIGLAFLSLTFLSVSAVAAVPGTLQFSTPSYLVDENDGTVSISVSRSGGTDGQITVDYATSDGGASAGSDYVAQNNTLTFEDGDEVKSIIIGITNDGVYEQTETFNLALSNVTGGATLGLQATAVSISDDDAVPGSLRFQSTSYEVAENSGTLTVTVERVGGSDGEITVDVESFDGSAVGGNDYTHVESMLTFANGQASETFTVSILDDSIFESNETFELTLDNPTVGVGLSFGQDTTTVIINENGTIGLSLAVGPDPSIVGGVQQVSLTASNNSNDFADGVFLGGNFPEGVVALLESQITGGGICEGEDGICETGDGLYWDIGTLAAGESVTVTLPATIDNVPSPATVQETLGFIYWSFEVQVNGETINEAGAEVEIASSQALTLSIDEDKMPVEAGELLTYTIHYGNQSAADIENVELYFSLPENTSLESSTFVPSTSNEPLGGGDYIVWQLGTLVAGTVGRQQVIVRVAEGVSDGVLLAVESSIYTGKGDQEKSQLNEAAEEQSSAWSDANSVTVVGTPSLSLDIAATPDPTQAGNTLDVALTITNPNTSASTFSGIELDLRYPVNLDDLNTAPATSLITNGGNCDDSDIGQPFECESTEVIHWDIGTLNPGESTTVSLPPVVAAAALNGSLIPWRGQLIAEGMSEIWEDITIGVGSLQKSALNLAEELIEVTEGNFSSVTLTVNRTGNTSEAVTVDYTTTPGTALEGEDYGSNIAPTEADPLTGTLTFAAWEVSKSVTIGILDDNIVEDAESFTFTLSNASVNSTLGTNQATTNIADDDQDVGFTVAQASVEEGSQPGTIELTVSRSGDINNGVWVEYEITEGTATEVEDYTGELLIEENSNVAIAGPSVITGELEFESGEISQTITINIVDDQIFEETEDFTVSLVAIKSENGNAEFSDIPAVTVSIINDDVPGTLQFGALSYSVNEGNDPELVTVTIPVTRTGGTDGTVEVDYATAGGTASAGNDFTTHALTTLTFEEGETSKLITVDIIGDTLYELTETFTLTLSKPTAGATLGSVATATVSILDNDAIPGIFDFAAPSYSVNEDAGTVTVTVSRTGGFDGATSVDYATLDGSAFAGTDYEATSGRLDFANTETSKTVVINLIDDATFEGPEAFTLGLTNATGGATLGDTFNTTISIAANDAVQGVLQFESASISVDENAGTIFATITRTGGSDDAVSVDVAAVAGSADGTDYTVTAGTIAFANGETSKTVPISIVNDGDYEETEAFTLELSNAIGGAVLGSQTSFAVSILDDDAISGTIEMASSAVTVAENDGLVEIEVTRSGGSDGAVSVNYASSNNTATSVGDYQAVSGTVNFLNGETSKKITVAITDDSAFEPTEDFTVTLSNPTGGATLGSSLITTVSITDTDTPVPGTLAFVGASQLVAEDAGEVVVTVIRTGHDGEISVDYSTGTGNADSGSDYLVTSGTLYFADGQTSGTIKVSILDDTLVEADETFTLTLSNATGGASLVNGSSSTTVSIVDNDIAVPGTLQFIASNHLVGESVGTVTVTVIRSGSNGEVSIDYSTSDDTAESGSDYQLTSGTLVFADGQTSGIIEVPVTNDNLVEGDEAFTLILSNATGGASIGSLSSTTISITDNDVAVPGILQFAVSNQAVGEGAGNVIVRVVRTGGSDGAVSVDYETSNSSAVLGSDYSQTSGTLLFADGQTMGTIEVPVIDDNAIESDETFTVNLSNVVGGATLGSVFNTSISITDNEVPVPGTLQFNPSIYSVSETSDKVTVVVARTGGSNGIVTIEYATQDATATVGSDYEATTGTLTFADGEVNKTISINILENSGEEGDETFEIVLGTITGGASVGGQDTATITITEPSDDESDSKSSSSGSFGPMMLILLLIAGLAYRRRTNLQA